jgi:hypothetical protein
MKNIHYDLVAEGNDWVIQIDGKAMHRYPSLPEAEAAAFDMARTDRDRGFHVQVRLPPTAEG